MTGEGKPSVSVAVAVYRSEPTLRQLVDELLSVLRPLVSDLEIVLVDDASSDRSWRTIVSLAEEHREIIGIRLATGLGEDGASRLAMATTRFDVVVTLDDDLQHPPQEIPRLLGALAGGADLVYGTSSRLAHGALRRTGTRWWKAALVRWADLPAGVAPTSFRAMRGDIRVLLEPSNVPLDVQLGRAARRVEAVEVRHEPRRAGRSGYTLASLIDHALRQLVGYDAAILGSFARGARAAMGGGLVLAFAAAWRRRGRAGLATSSSALLAMGVGLAVLDRRVDRLRTEQRSGVRRPQIGDVVGPGLPASKSTEDPDVS